MDEFFDEHIVEELIEYIQDNGLPKAFDLFYEAISFVTTENLSSASKAHYNVSEIVEFCMNHKIPDGCDRRNKLFREIAIWAVNEGKTYDEMKEIDRIIVSNCPGRKVGEIMGWIPWVRQNKPKQNPLSLKDVIRSVNAKGGAESAKG